MPVFVTERYRLAAVPGLMILGVAGLWVFWENLVSARWGAAAIYVGLSGAAAWFVSIPRDDIGLWSLDHYKAGIRATTAGQLEIERKDFAAAGRAFDRAQRNLETAYAYVPNNADIDFALGNLWLARGDQPANDEHAAAADRTKAKLFYRRALDLNSHHVGTLNNLGVLAMEEKRWDVAGKFFTAALQAEPEDAKTHYLLARVHFEDGQPEAARAELEIALRIRPNQREFLALRDQLAAPGPKPAR
jgi:tetratricopeptide (TPR) repeat protein